MRNGGTMGRLAKLFNEEGRVVCVMCHKPGILRAGDRCSVCGFLGNGKHRAITGDKMAKHRGHGKKSHR